MDILIDLLKEYGIYLLTSAGVVLSIVLGRPKTAEKLEKKKQKRKQKLLKKAKKLSYKCYKIYKIFDPNFFGDSNEIEDIHEPWLDEVEKNG